MCLLPMFPRGGLKPSTTKDLELVRHSGCLQRLSLPEFNSHPEGFEVPRWTEEPSITDQYICSIVVVEQPPSGAPLRSECVALRHSKLIIALKLRRTVTGGQQLRIHVNSTRYYEGTSMQIHPPSRSNEASRLCNPRLIADHCSCVAPLATKNFWQSPHESPILHKESSSSALVTPKSRSDGRRLPQRASSLSRNSTRE